MEACCLDVIYDSLFWLFATTALVTAEILFINDASRIAGLLTLLGILLMTFLPPHPPHTEPTLAVLCSLTIPAFAIALRHTLNAHGLPPPRRPLVHMYRLRSAVSPYGDTRLSGTPSTPTTPPIRHHNRQHVTAVSYRSSQPPKERNRDD